MIIADVFADYNSNDVALEKIVITPVRYAQETQKIASSMSLITQQEIKDLNAQTVPDILRLQTGLVVRDYYGNGTKASVDLRGFGETAGSNTLILVDGRRINEIDLSGVDWTQIPLDRVERIEIVRGANSVLYGDNAVGGVINVITKTGKGKPHFEFESTFGSYDMNKQKLSISGSQKNLSYFFNLSRSSTDGYRKNSDYKDNDFYSKFIYDLSDDISLSLSSGFHDSDYGLPGSLRESQLATSSRRDSMYMDDNAGEEDYYILTDSRIKFLDNNEFALPISFRKRYMNTYWGTGGWGVNRSGIDTIGICPKLILNTNIFKRPNITNFGLDFYKVDSTLRDYSLAGAKTGDSDVDKKSLGVYLQNDFSIFDNLIFNTGYRYEKVRYDFDYLDFTGMYTNVDDLTKFKEQVFKTGLVYGYKDNCSVFLNIAKSYRLPVTEEFMRYNFFAWPFGRYINKSLVPQRALNYEIGFTNVFDSKLETSLTGFLMKLKNELYFNPVTFNNENYDKTEHRGLEMGWKLNMLENLSLFGNYTFTEAILDRGMYNNNQIPAVPRHKATFGLNWKITSRLHLNGVLSYIGERYFISDQAHNYPKMDDFATADIKISYNFSAAEAFIGINNIFNDMYSEYGVISTIFNERGYYPSPGRNFTFGFSCRY